PLFRAEGRFGRAPGLLHLASAANQLGQALQGILAILFLGAVLLRLDDDHPVGGDAAVAQRQQAFLVERRQRRGTDIEAQMQRAGHLVDVLPAGALGTDRAQLDFAVGQFDGIGNVQHGGLGEWPGRQDNAGPAGPRPAAPTRCGTQRRPEKAPTALPERRRYASCNTTTANRPRLAPRSNRLWHSTLLVSDQGARARPRRFSHPKEAYSVSRGELSMLRISHYLRALARP